MREDKILLTPELEPGTEVITWVGDTPLTRHGFQWLPVSQLLVWLFYTRQASRRRPTDTVFHWGGEGLLKTAATLGPEWCHNLAHLLVSHRIGKPMDELLVQYGMPRCIYRDPNDETVAPQQHIARSLGGPLINLILLPISWLTRKLTRPGTIPGEAAKTFYQTNLFISLVSFLPIPWIDGGPILKWSLVDRGHSPQQADRVVQEANGPLALILGLFSSWSFARKRVFAGFISALLGLVSLAVYAGWLKEEDLP